MRTCTNTGVAVPIFNSLTAMSDTQLKATIEPNHFQALAPMPAARPVANASTVAKTSPGAPRILRPASETEETRVFRNNLTLCRPHLLVA
jgi:hypothetical protein